ncbi:3713_t:CDS:2 [Paraglomus brasilianum]|uniref:3713_t:CDS:1 n=1 Tax=Paraglomus brasilianum TaxID=144538 RepID=A0A9N8VVW7_9GLOM|nr:3713_t:CDS:2 [Paraglomus brasilianum]
MSETTATETTATQTQTVYQDTELINTVRENTNDPNSRTIVIALDHSEHSHHAFNWAVKNFLRKECDKVVLVNVRPVPTVPGPYGEPAAIGAAYMDFSEVVSSLEDQYRSNSHSLLKDFAGKLKTQGFECKAIAMRGDARDELVRKVDELNAEALVIGSRGLGVFKRTILGSVSDYCSHHCDCTVVIVKDKEAH